MLHSLYQFGEACSGGGFRTGTWWGLPDRQTGNHPGQKVFCSTPMFN